MATDIPRIDPDNRNDGLRDYGADAQILLDPGVREMVMLASRAVRPARRPLAEDRRLAAGG